ncbi:MAG: type 4a pilus biogenesis protein PilO [Pseudobdellovibrionaceae bacterium]|nr:type 4a pilus biogenesis protein PilO [Bdellovibrionales bacterium]USN47451.1 MAG: type 4a pilus biogenesis protein PilO [Pseudobdellovibrionaceae bacterium]
MEEKLNQLTLQQSVLIGIGLAVLYFFVMFDDGTSKENQIKNMKDQVAAKEQEIAKYDKTIKDAERFKVVAEELGEEMNRILNYIPADLSGVELMKTMSNEARVAGVNINNVQSSGGEKTDYNFIEAIGVTVDLRGSYGQLLSFMSYLTKVEKIVTLKEFEMRSTSGKNNEDNELTFKAKFKGFKYVVEENKNDKKK